MSIQHGGATRFLIDEDIFVESSNGNLHLSGQRSQEHINRFLNLFGFDGSPNQPVFCYSRLFRKPLLGEYRPASAGLIELGRSMEVPNGSPPSRNLNIPAGYTYLGQFIDHDLSFDQLNRFLPVTGTLDPSADPTTSSPSLDLDCLYGINPERLRRTAFGAKIYSDDGLKLREGHTDPDEVSGIFPNDLPREEKKAVACIVDPRNDENVAIAQTHLAFIKFHNHVVDYLRNEGVPTHKLFQVARETVTRHYQWIILFDFLERIIETDVRDDVIENGYKFFVTLNNEQLLVPVEFAVGAYRFGHSLISNSYEWNRVFQTGARGPATLRLMFAFTGFGNENLAAQHHLPNSWIIDWTRFYDFTGFYGVTNNSQSNLTRLIGPSLVAELMRLPDIPGENDPLLRILAVRSLLRGRLLGLPAGQWVAKRIRIDPMAPDEIAVGPQAEVLRGFGFDRTTPLWYYVLREAEFYHQGERLGPVGSRIVAETFVRLIRASQISILRKDSPGRPIWEPFLGVTKGHFSMPDLLYFVNKHELNYLNPLGD